MGGESKEDPALPGTEEDPRNIPCPRRHLKGPVRQEPWRPHGQDGDEWCEPQMML